MMQILEKSKIYASSHKNFADVNEFFSKMYQTIAILPEVIENYN